MSSLGMTTNTLFTLFTFLMLLPIAVLLGRCSPLGTLHAPLRLKAAKSLMDIAAFSWGVAGTSVMLRYFGVPIEMGSMLFFVEVLTWGTLGATAYLFWDLRSRFNWGSSRAMARPVYDGLIKELDAGIMDPQIPRWVPLLGLVPPLLPVVVLSLVGRMYARLERRDLVLELEALRERHYPSCPQVIEQPNRFGFMELVPNPEHAAQRDKTSRASAEVCSW